jgi:protein gp37
VLLLTQDPPGTPQICGPADLHLRSCAASWPTAPRSNGPTRHWNPVTGCTKVSPGWKNCYAERLAARLQAMGNRRYRNGFDLTLHPDQLTLPLRWREPRRVFVNSMSDLFHEAVPEEFIHRAFDVMAQAHWHVFQVLTKRSRRLAELAPRLRWPSNVWQGVSVENARYTSRVADLMTVRAAVRFLSVEPLLGPIPELPLKGIAWVIVEGSKHHRVPSPLRWVRLTMTFSYAPLIRSSPPPDCPLRRTRTRAFFPPAVV